MNDIDSYQNHERDLKMLMQEYDIGLRTTRDMESPIWRTQAIIGVVSIGAFAFILSNEPVRANMGIVVGIGVFVNLFSSIWYQMANRWLSIQHTIFTRLQDIEIIIQEHYTKMGPKIQGYIKRRDSVKDHPNCKSEWHDNHLSAQGLEDTKLDDVSKYQSHGTKEWSKYLLLLIRVGWGLYIYVVGLRSLKSTISVDAEILVKILAEITVILAGLALLGCGLFGFCMTICQFRCKK